MLLTTIRLAKRARDYAAVKDTAGWLREQQREVAKTAAYCQRLGYSRDRGYRAAESYLEAARDTRLGPDWPGFRRAIRDVGLADTPADS